MREMNMKKAKKEFWEIAEARLEELKLATKGERLHTDKSGVIFRTQEGDDAFNRFKDFMNMLRL
jgi:hypothetical protein